MKKLPVMLMLFLSINARLFAQKNNSDKVFDIVQGAISRVYYIDLDKGNKMKLELTDLDDLDAIGNMDSILKVFVQDIEPLKDSLTDELVSKRIDYIVDVSGKNKIRLQKFTTTGSSYLSSQGTIASLKLEQDTVNIILKASGGAPKLFKNKTAGSHYFRISYFLNNLGDLAAYMDGRSQNSIRDIQKNANGKWVKDKDGITHSKSIPAISSNSWRGQVTGGDFISFRLTSDIQNYKNYFVPSLTASVVLVTNHYSIKREFSFSGESHFTFARNSQGKLQTFRSSFLTLGYTQVNSKNDRSVSDFSPSFSLGFMVRQRGSIFDKNTFRLGFGKASLFNGLLKLEPIIYFHDFFKNVTPGIRLSL